MSNLERDPSELVIAGGTGAVATATPSDSVDAGSATAGARTAPGQTADAAAPVLLLLPRDVPLGGPRAMNVRRTLPQRGRSTIGAWCFIDHYGPDEIAPPVVPETASGNATGTGTGSGTREEATGGVADGARRGMVVPPHPHTGLQTVSWLFEGEIEHRDSAGSHAPVLPGELNLMTAGRGISHSEVSTPETRVLHGVQLWLALPEEHRHQAPHFEHLKIPQAPLGGGATARVFIGGLAGDTGAGTGPLVSAARVYSPVLGAQVDLPSGAALDLDLDPAFEHGILVDRGPVLVEGVTLARSELGYLAEGRRSIRLENHSRHPARVLLLGGEPFTEKLVMWWNFIGRTHEEVVAWRAEWQSEVIDGADAAGRFGTVAGYPGPALPAP
ncbi:pirin family protein, partial [Cryobacterium sp. 10I5]|uniref:pirin family protein n=1 Tax=Cryobacterium sp. 10I5 TaxID=3048581 RepID=UPI003A5998C0